MLPQSKSIASHDIPTPATGSFGGTGFAKQVKLSLSISHPISVAGVSPPVKVPAIGSASLVVPLADGALLQSAKVGIVSKLAVPTEFFTNPPVAIPQQSGNPPHVSSTPVHAEYSLSLAPLTDAKSAAKTN